MIFFRKPGRLAAVLLVAALLVSGSAGASGEWLTFDAEGLSVPQAYLVQEYTGTVRITFLGDCTLGGEEKTLNDYRGFAQTVARNGYAYPFRNLIELTAADDLTVANLEGVLSAPYVAPPSSERLTRRFTCLLRYLAANSTLVTLCRLKLVKA